MSTVLYLLAFVFIAAIQGVLVRSSCTICEVEPRGFGASAGMAWLTWLLSSLVGLVWNWTFGWLVWFFVGATVTSVLAGVVGWLTATLVFKRWLGIGFGHAALIWTIYAVGASLLSGLIYSVLGFVF